MSTQIGKYLKFLRIKTGDNLTKMSEKLKISAAYLSAIENGKRNIPEDFFNNLTNVYELDEDEKKVVKTAIFNSNNNYKIDLSNISDKKKEILLSLESEEIDDSTLEKLCIVIKESQNKDN